MPGTPDPTGTPLSWHEMIEHLPHPVAVFDGACHMVFANRAWQALGCVILPDPLREAVTRAANDADGGTHGRDIGSDAMGWFDWTVTPLPGQALAAIWLTDATPRRTADALSERHMLFLRAMAHDIGSPMQAVSGFAELALQRAESNPAAPPNPAHLRMIDDASRQAVAQLARRIELAQVLFGTETGETGPISLGTLLRAVVGELQTMAAESGIRLALNDGPDPIILGDEAELRRCLIAIVTNAITVTVSGGTVDVTLDEPEQGLCAVRVIDRGPAVAASDLERFRQSPVGTSVRKNLALALARALARRQNGEVAIESGPDGGIVVRLTLPASPSIR